MIKRFLIGILFLLSIDAALFSEAAVGVTLSNAIGTSFFYDDIYNNKLDPKPIFAGLAFRWQPSPLFLDISGKYWPYGGMIHSNINVGLSTKGSLILFGVSGGFDAIALPNPGSGSIVAFGSNIKLHIDVRVKPISVGINVSLPIDLYGNVQKYGYPLVSPFDELRIYAAQVSMCVMYWF